MERIALAEKIVGVRSGKASEGSAAAAVAAAASVSAPPVGAAPLVSPGKAGGTTVAARKSPERRTYDDLSGPALRQEISRIRRASEQRATAAEVAALLNVSQRKVKKALRRIAAEAGDESDPNLPYGRRVNASATHGGFDVRPTAAQSYRLFGPRDGPVAGFIVVRFAAVSVSPWAYDEGQLEASYFAHGVWQMRWSIGADEDFTEQMYRLLGRF